MKLRGAIILSVVLHISLFVLAVYLPGDGGGSGTVYYVDLISMPGGGGGGGKGQLIEQPAEPQRMKDLTTQTQESETSLRYKDDKIKKNSRKASKKKKPKKKLITVSRKKPTQKNISVTRKSNLPSNVLKTGISAGGGSGGGSGGGTGSGSGSGYGPGSGLGGFPYAYYIETLKNKISSSWYNALISPGMRGRFVAVVYFKIMRNGRITDLKVSNKSGIGALDLSALRAIENAAPFPPLPSDYTDRYLGVYFEFEWEKK